jgi:hypothetical protein
MYGLACEDHHGPYRFVRLYGADSEPKRLPEGFQRGERNCCFANAFRLARARSGLSYVEGFGTLWGSDTSLHRHAWCVDDRGQVIDPTWGIVDPLPLALRGLVLPLGLVAPYCDDRSRGTLDGGLRDELHIVAQALGLRWPA